MKKQISNLLIAVALLGAVMTGASAAELPQQSLDRGMYWGMMWNPVLYGYDYDKNDSSNSGGAIGFFPPSLEVSVGYQFNRYFAVEGMAYTALVAVIPTVAGKVILPLGQHMNVYAKGGVGIGMVDLADDDGDGMSGSKVAPYAAVGTAFHLSKRTDLNIEGSAFFFKSDGEYAAAGFGGVGFTYHF